MAERPPKRPKRLAVPGSQARIELPAPEMERVREVARRNGLSLSAAIRQAVAFWVTEMERRVGQAPAPPLLAVQEPLRPAGQGGAGRERGPKPRAPRTTVHGIDRELLRLKARDLQASGMNQRGIAATLEISVGLVNKLLRGQGGPDPDREPDAGMEGGS